MRKKVICFVLLIAIVLGSFSLLSGCNKQIIDTKYNFKWVCLELPNGEIVEGKCESWRDYENSDSIQITINGITYYTHLNRVVLSTKEP